VLARQAHVAAEVFGRQRLLEPGDVDRRSARARRSASDTVKHWLASVMISKAVAHRLAHGRQPRDVFGDTRPPTLILAPLNPSRLGLQRLAHQRIGSRCSQPPSVV
jgi:hypothetical protein